MKVFLATDFRCFVFKGEYYLAPKAYTIFKRYTDAFGDITLCSRFVEVDKIEGGDKKADFIKDVVKIGNVTKALLGVYNSKMLAAMKDCGLVIVRLHSFIGFAAADCARKLGKPYLAESMGDAWDAMWNHGLSGKILAPYMFLKMKSVVKHADYAVYVTSEFLQKRYPCPNPSIAASNVFIPKTDESVLQKRFEGIENMNMHNITIMTTAAVNIRYKGQQYVIEAIPKLNAAGIKVKYVLLGEGDSSYLQGVAKKYGVEDQVFFAGRTSLEGVFRLLDEADLYIQPSLQEGLPRSVIEAMSRGCPCIGANTAGIPELLEDEFIVRRKSVDDIAEKIKSYLNLSRDEKKKKAHRNYIEAQKYTAEILDSTRQQYFSTIAQRISE